MAGPLARSNTWGNQMDADLKNSKSGQLGSTGKTNRLVGSNERNVMFACLLEIVLDGLRHGFFDCAITCELVNDRKRRVVIKAGKSHQFTIREEELHD
jgi:hypothetical protein